MNKEIGKLGKRDAIKAMFMFVCSTVLASIIEVINNNGFEITLQDTKQVLVIALTSTLTYILKNFLSDKNDKIVGKY